MKKASEADLAAVLIADRRALGWTCYEEVRLSTRSDGRCDIVATLTEPVRQAQASGAVVQERVTISCFEVKTALSFDVLAQADRWRDLAHETWVVVPKPRRGVLHPFALRVAKQFGIGVIQICAVSKQVRIRVPAQHHGISDETVARVVTKLFPEQIGQGLAGTNQGGYVTPFSRTCGAVREVLGAKGPMSLKKLVQSIRHHYASNASAVSSLRERIARGVVPGLELVTIDGLEHCRSKT